MIASASGTSMAALAAKNPVRPVQPEHRDPHQCRHRQVRPDEQRHRPHPAADMSAPHHRRDRARQHHRGHHRHPHAGKYTERTTPVGNLMSIPFICRTATTQHTAASPSVAASAGAVTAARAPGVAAEREAGAAAARLPAA